MPSLQYKRQWGFSFYVYDLRTFYSNLISLTINLCFFSDQRKYGQLHVATLEKLSCALFVCSVLNNVLSDTERWCSKKKGQDKRLFCYFEGPVHTYYILSLTSMVYRKYALLWLSKIK